MKWRFRGFAIRVPRESGHEDERAARYRTVLTVPIAWSQQHVVSVVRAT